MKSLAEIKTVRDIAYADISQYLRTRYTRSELRHGLIVTPSTMRYDSSITDLNKQLGIHKINK